MSEVFLWQAAANRLGLVEIGGRIGATALDRFGVELTELFLNISAISGGGFWSLTGSRFVKGLWEDGGDLSGVLVAVWEVLRRTLPALCLDFGGGEVEGGLGEAEGEGGVGEG